MPDITTVQTVTSDITTVRVIAQDATTVTVNQIANSTILRQTGGTIAVQNLSNSTPADIGRTASVGTSSVAARADHVHSAATLLLDGGNY